MPPVGNRRVMASPMRNNQSRVLESQSAADFFVELFEVLDEVAGSERETLSESFALYTIEGLRMGQTTWLRVVMSMIDMFQNEHHPDLRIDWTTDAIPIGLPTPNMQHNVHVIIERFRAIATLIHVFRRPSNRAQRE